MEIRKKVHSMSIIFGAMVPHPPLIIPQVGKGEDAGIEDGQRI